MDAKQKTLKQKVVRGCGYAALYFCFLLMTIPTIGAIDQVRIWLKTGTAPQRDLFWLAAPELCAETYGKGLKLYESKDLCRSSYIHFTDWVGIDRLLNQFFDFNLFVVALLTCVWTAAIAMKVMEANDPYS